MPLLDTCKFEENVIKIVDAMPRTMSNMVFFNHSMTSNFNKSCTKWLKVRTYQRCYACPGCQEFD